MSDFGKWLKDARIEAGLSLRQVEQRIDKLCTFGYLNQLEKGVKGKKGQEYQPDIAIVDALAKAFNKSINEARKAAGYAPIENSTEYKDEFESLYENLKESFLASGADDIENFETKQRIFEDLQGIARTMIQQEIKRQNARSRKG